MILAYYYVILKCKEIINIVCENLNIIKRVLPRVPLCSMECTQNMKNKNWSIELVDCQKVLTILTLNFDKYYQKTKFYSINHLKSITM